jgi:hypothetical protein
LTIFTGKNWCSAVFVLKGMMPEETMAQCSEVSIYIETFCSIRRVVSTSRDTINAHKFVSLFPEKSFLSNLLWQTPLKIFGGYYV